jgi:hypothetical protein
MGVTRAYPVPFHLLSLPRCLIFTSACSLPRSPSAISDCRCRPPPRSLKAIQAWEKTHRSRLFFQHRVGARAAGHRRRASEFTAPSPSSTSTTVISHFLSFLGQANELMSTASLHRHSPTAASPPVTPCPHSLPPFPYHYLALPLTAFSSEVSIHPTPCACFPRLQHGHGQHIPRQLTVFPSPIRASG